MHRRFQVYEKLQKGTLRPSPPSLERTVVQALTNLKAELYEKRKDLRSMLEKLDKDRLWLVSRTELEVKLLAMSSKLSAKDVSTAAAAFEPKGGGKVLWSELYRAILNMPAGSSASSTAPSKPWQTDEIVKKAFSKMADEMYVYNAAFCALIEKLDSAGSGTIDRAKFEAAILGINFDKKALSQADVALVLKTFDTSGSGVLKWETLYGELWRQGLSKATELASKAQKEHDARSAKDWREIDACDRRLLGEQSTRLQRQSIAAHDRDSGKPTLGRLLSP